MSVSKSEDAADALNGLAQFAFMRRPLAALLQAYAESSLDLIVLKGAALAETVYSHPSLRPFGDLDVLVRAEDAARAFDLLSSLGYITEANIWADLRAGRSCEANFFKHMERGTVVVELHTDLLNNAILHRAVCVDLGGLWARSVPACLAGQDARVLGPEDQIFHLCLHLAGHYFHAPKSVRDIAEVCAAGPVDWPLFVSVCRAAGAGAIGYSGLFAAKTHYDAEIPPAVLSSLAPPSRRRLKALVAAQTAPGAGPQSESQRFELLWRLLGSGKARLFAVRHLLFPPRAWLHTHYFFDLPATVRCRRLPVGARLYGAHLKFLASVLRRGRK